MQNQRKESQSKPDIRTQNLCKKENAALARKESQYTDECKRTMHPFILLPHFRSTKQCRFQVVSSIEPLIQNCASRGDG